MDDEIILLAEEGFKLSPDMINMVSSLERLKDGKRVISKICEAVNENKVIGEKSEIIIKDIFNYCRTLDKDKNINTANCFKFSGHIPLFLKNDF